MKQIKKEIRTNEKSICYTHLETGSKRICFMLSGIGYNYDKPLFYFSTMKMLENKVDIVHIHYAYEENLIKKSLEEITRIMMEDVNPVIADVLKNGKYDETIFLGKSLGTVPIVNVLMDQEQYLNSTMILYTPLLKLDSIFETILNSPHKGLLVIGDKDRHYNSKQISQLCKTNLEINVVKNANHSLNIGEFETINSIQGLSSVMEKLQEMIKVDKDQN